MLSLRDKALLLKLFYKNEESASLALRSYRTIRGVKNGKGPMTLKALKDMVKKFEATGSLEDLQRCGRPKNSTEVVKVVEQDADRQSTSSVHGECSARAISRRTGISYGSVWRSLRVLLKRYPYKLQHVHELKSVDLTKRQDFANWALVQMEENPDWLLNIFWTDEAHFSLSGSVNTKNCRIWARENPHRVIEKPLHDAKVTVWCGFTASFIIGPIFIEELYGDTFQTVSVTGERYEALIKNKVIPYLQERQALQSVMFMQDGAPPHIAAPVKTLLRSTFGDNRILSRGFPLEWPPRSPDLTPCDFWLWGYLKSHVYRDQPTSLDELKEAIRHRVSCIPSEMLFNAVQSVFNRLTAVIISDGNHIE